MFKKEENKVNENTSAQFEEMEQVEELGDGWFVAGAAAGVAVGVAIVVLT